MRIHKTLILLVASVICVSSQALAATGRHSSQQFQTQPFLGGVCVLLADALGNMLGLENSSSNAITQRRISNTALRKEVARTQRDIQKDLTITRNNIRRLYETNTRKVAKLYDDPRSGLAFWLAEKARIQARSCDGTPQTNCTEAEKTFWLSRADSNAARVRNSIEKLKAQAMKFAQQKEAARLKRQQQAMARLQRVAARAGGEGTAVVGDFLSWIGQFLLGGAAMLAFLGCQIAPFALF